MTARREGVGDPVRPLARHRGSGVYAMTENSGPGTCNAADDRSRATTKMARVAVAVCLGFSLNQLHRNGQPYVVPQRKLAFPVS